MVVNIGVQSFERIREADVFYVDKTDFIRQWWEAGDDTTLITRPRRFGKTLNLNMLECFFSNKYANRGDLFEGLSIWEDEGYRKLQGTYPVIFLSFASVKTGDIEEIKIAIKLLIANVYNRFRDIMQSEIFDADEREHFQEILCRTEDDMTASMAVNALCGYLEKYYGQKAIVLLDEYDTPMQEAWLAGNWDETVTFFRLFFNATFKTNPYMYRSVITGITRISKESIFSDLNHLEVVTATSEKYATCFGFTEREVFASLDLMGLSSEKQEVKRWYDGFTFGGHADIYNPWSITKFLSSRGKYESYWADTSGYGRYDVMIEPLDKSKKAFIFEFKVQDADDDEITLEDTAANALAQIAEKKYEAILAAKGISQENIRKYGFAFRGKECLIKEG